MFLPQDVQHLLTDEFIENPSFRTLSSFFLGGVFLLALKYIAKSPGLQWVSRGIGNLITPRSSSQLSLEQLEEDADEKARLKRWIEETFCGPSDNMDPKNIVLILSFFAANASLAMFGSTLQFMKGQDAVCTFTITWGGLSAQMIRIMGFIRLVLDIRTLGASRWEMYFSWLYMLGLVVLMMFHNAIASGILLPFPRFTGWALCYRQHYPLTAWISSLSNIVFEFYIIFRLAWLLAPAFMTIQHQWRGLKDMRLAKALSLFLMDLLTTVPCVVPLSTAAEYIPFSVAAILVLVTFNHERARAVRALSRVDSIPSTRMLNLERDDDSMMIRTIQESLGQTTPRRSGTMRSPSRRRSAFRTSEPFSLAAISAERRQSRPVMDIDAMFATANSAPSTSNQFRRRHSSPGISLGRRRHVSTVSAPVRSNGFFSRGSRSSRDQSSTSIIVHLPSTDDRSPSSSPNSTKFPSPHPDDDKYVAPDQSWPISPQTFGFKIPPVPSSAPPIPPKPLSAQRSARSRASSKFTPRNSSDEPRVSQSHSSSNLSTKSRGDNNKRWSNWTGWLSADGESPNMYQRSFTNLRESYSRRATAKSDHTFGPVAVGPGPTTGRSTGRSSKVRFSRSETSRPDAMASILPYYMPDIGPTGPTSPVTAPISRTSIVPVVEPSFSYVTAQGSRYARPERNGTVASGAVRDPTGKRTSVTRVRFGARPLRSALSPEGAVFREDGLPREVLSPPGGIRKTAAAAPGKSK